MVKETPRRSINRKLQKNKDGEKSSVGDRMAGEYRTTNRIFAILALLEGSSHGLTVKMIHERLIEDHPADERTYRRDVENLEYLDFLTKFSDPDDEVRAMRYKANRTLKVGRTLTLDIRELFALYVARNMLTPLRDTPLYSDLERMFKRIEQGLGPRCQEHLQELAADIHFAPGPRWSLGIHPEVLDVAEKCCAEGHILTAEYSSVNSGDKRKRTLGPHFLYFATGALYLIAEDMEDGQVKTFALPRFHNAVMTEQVYTGTKVIPETYFASAISIFRGQPERIELIFHPPAEHIRERRWHASQVTLPYEDGSIHMTLDVAVTQELVQWILGFGAGVEIVSPKSLTKQIIEAAKAVIEQYGKKRVA